MDRKIDIFNSGQPHRGAENFTCPRCGVFSHQYPAISRVDNKTKICSVCGTDEGLFCRCNSRSDFLEMSQQWMAEAEIEFPKERLKEIEKFRGKDTA